MTTPSSPSCAMGAWIQPMGMRSAVGVAEFSVMACRILPYYQALRAAATSGVSFAGFHM